MPRKNSNVGGRKSKAREVPSKVVEDRKDVGNTAVNPLTDQKAIQDRRNRDADRKAQQVKDREELLVRAATGGDSEHPDVAVVKTSEAAARAEQERLDIAKRAAEKQGDPPQAMPLPPTEGTVPAEYLPAHPLEPDPTGSAPHDPSTPAGPMGEDVIHVTDDIEADGSPKIRGRELVEPSPEINGETGAEYPEGWSHGPAEQVGPVDENGELEPVINQHSPEGARLDEIKLQRPVFYVPNEFTLDPQSGEPEKKKALAG